MKKTLDRSTIYQIARDINGNKVCRIRVYGCRAFTIQTNGNMPKTHRDGVGPWTSGEALSYAREFGTAKQREALNALRAANATAIAKAEGKA